jgi:hypothetical protein
MTCTITIGMVRVAFKSGEITTLLDARRTSGATVTTSTAVFCASAESSAIQ